MNVLFLTLDSYGGYGGIAQYCSDVVRALASFSTPTRTTLMSLHAPPTTSALPPRMHLTQARGSRPRYLLQVMRQAVRGHHPDLILCGHINLLPLARMVGMITRAPVVLFIYGIDAWNPLRSWRSRFLPGISAVVSISRVTLERFQNWAPVQAIPSHILPNAIDLDRFTPGQKDPGLLERYDLVEKKVLMTFGRISPHERYKGFDEVIEILPALIREFPNLVYVIAGTGDDVPRLRHKARDRGLETHLRFTGYVEESFKIPLYRCADAYVMPSRGEGFGFVLLEAAACGIPVIGSVLDGTREALRDGLLGRLVHPDDQQALIAACTESLTHATPPDRKILEGFAFPAFVLSLQHLISQTLTTT